MNTDKETTNKKAEDITEIDVNEAENVTGGNAIPDVQDAVDPSTRQPVFPDYPDGPPVI